MGRVLQQFIAVVEICSDYVVEAHCHVIELDMGEFVSNSHGIESQ